MKRKRFALTAVTAMLIVLTHAIAFAAQGGKIVAGKARFTVIAPELVRMEYSKDAKFLDEPTLFAINRDAHTTEYNLMMENGKTIIETTRFKLTYAPDGNIFSPQNLQVEIKKAKEVVTWAPGAKSRGNLGGTIRTVDGVSKPVYLNEGVLSVDGWFFLDDTKRHIFTKDWVARNPRADDMDGYLFAYGIDYKAALRALTKISGDVPMPRKYVLGSWYSRYWPYTSQEYREIVNEFKQHDFPLDVMVMDMDWHKDGWTGWSPNRKLLPDFEELLKFFHDKGIFVTLNLHPSDGVGPHEDMYDAFMKAMGKDTATKETIVYDAGDKKYLDTLFEYTHTPLEKLGVDFWWLDWQQYENTKSIVKLSNLSWLNHYYYTHTSKNNLRGQSFSRWGGWGDHRHPIHFSGDAHTDWPMLAFEVPLTATAGNMGCFFWSHDIGGHMGPRNEETITRWVQFGAMSAALRLHSTRSADLDKRPWKYSKWAEDAMKVAYHVRSELFPYIYSSVWQSHKNSLPLTRPMYIEYPEDPRAYVNAQQYMFGDAFIVASIVTPGLGPNKLATQSVWFPEGVWYNWFTGEKYVGPKETFVTADINEIPLFVKGGVPIPMQPYTQRMTTTPLKELVIRVFPGEDGKTYTTTLYEDDGTTQDYLKGKYATMVISYTRNDNNINIAVAPAKGNYKGQFTTRSYVIELSNTMPVTNVKLDGKSINSNYDKELFTNFITIPARAVTQGFTLTAVAANEISADMLDVPSQKRKLKGILGDIPAKDYLRNYNDKMPNPGTVEALFAIAGIAVRARNDAPYLYGGKEKPYIYNNTSVVDGNRFDVVVMDERSKTKKLHEGSYTVNAQNSPVPVDYIISDPDLPPVGMTNKRVIQLNFKVSGKPVTLTHTLAERSSL